MNAKKSEEEFSEQETIARAEAAIKRMLATPHQPHSAMKLGKHKAKESAKASRTEKKRGTKKLND